MKYGMNMLLWSGDVTGSKFPALFERLKKTGFDLLEIPIFDPNIKKLTAVAKTLPIVRPKPARYPRSRMFPAMISPAA